MLKTISTQIMAAEDLVKLKDESFLWTLHRLQWQKNKNQAYLDLEHNAEQLIDLEQKLNDELNLIGHIGYEDIRESESQILKDSRQYFDSVMKSSESKTNSKKISLSDSGQLVKLADQVREILTAQTEAKKEIKEYQSRLIHLDPLRSANLSEQDFQISEWLNNNGELNRIAGFESFILDAARFREIDQPYSQFISEVETVDKELVELRNFIDRADPETWFFSSEEKREEGRRKVRQFGEIGLTTLKQKLGLSQKARNVSQKMQTEEASKYLSEDHNGFRYYIQSLIEPHRSDSFSRTYRQSVPTSIHLQLGRFDLGIRTLVRPEKEIEKLKKELTASIEKTMWKQLLQKLQQIPVSECSTAVKGLRVKSLMESGYETLADIVTASVYNLASVNGITINTAQAVKDFASDILESVKKETHLHLRELEDTAETRQLVLELHQILSLENVRNQIYDLKNGDYKSAEKCISRLRKIHLGAEWLTISDEKLEIIDSDYHFLKDFLEGDTFQKIREIDQQIEEILNTSEEAAYQDFKEYPVQYITLIENLFPELTGTEEGSYGLPDELASAVIDQDYFPDGLKISLRKYQIWGVKYALHQQRVLLGDDMGLGKTAQAIGTMVSLRNIGYTHFLVVCPLSVLVNWCREIRQFSRLKPTSIYGKDYDKALHSWIRTGGAGITTYETLNKMNLSERIKLDLLVVDEAHFIKNPNARRTRNVQKLVDRAERLLFMTGTPMENDVSEMLNLISMIQPSIVKRVSSMTRSFYDSDFREAIAPVYFRRKKETVLSELPDKIESEEWCTMGTAERLAYEKAVFNRHIMQVRQMSFDMDDLSNSCKAQRLIEIIEEAKANGNRVIVFSYFKNTIQRISKMLSGRAYGPIDGSVPYNKRQEIIDNFSKSPSGSVLLAQIQAGGTGLNIQAANVVVICEPQYKPSIEQQAIARSYRLGQAKDKVLVYRLLCDVTIENRVMEILQSKQSQFNRYADRSAAAEKIQSQNTPDTDMRDNPEIDTRTFNKLIEEEIERINAKRGRIS
ncbi:DEAD/DEAH box helicase [Ileibacterium valens]|uniref:DEAD/DEAH box helicase n=1 Tax=Ileibacterium valens TaxID=1862668 RepID=UPI0025744AEB|nr:DEAD/DEAH box helicase [Ileibacterium valens]